MPVNTVLYLHPDPMIAALIRRGEIINKQFFVGGVSIGRVIAVEDEKWTIRLEIEWSDKVQETSTIGRINGR